MTLRLIAIASLVWIPGAVAWLALVERCKHGRLLSCSKCKDGAK